MAEKGLQDEDYDIGFTEEETSGESEQYPKGESTPGFESEELPDLVFKLDKVFVDDIIFGDTNEATCKEYAEMMGNQFEMCMMSELNFFLGLQIKQTPTGTMIHQQKYIKELLKKFNMDSSKSIDTLISIATKLDLDE
ncbi:uncharacterized mitochondrial protein AtMg00810-like [Nicotiana tomentosiformis]|uniref:uncharacterized mitochondrial protein AtMg00810-like n=1 Tax=Nicotiana tomentosiformis TaxID=4098 RepID=UPI00388CADBB